ncbi:MAG: hypothetical protein ACI8QD_002475 [Cyclobacteriaceae bacterium]|jgi:hypothetical protein
MMAIDQVILAKTGATSIIQITSIQSLWSGYGAIKRYDLKGGKYRSVIVKHIQLPQRAQHPTGWDTDLSHQRKLTSYQVERAWYEQYASQTDNNCRVPESYYTVEEGTELLLIMEDLNASGYPLRLDPDAVKVADVKNCLSWLAHFHATFIGTEADGLWPTGTYWHLDTRPDELEQMSNAPLKHAATGIDERLKKAKFQTLVHGDAKIANFCFGQTGQVAAVDFQYVGKGCGIKDVAYLISSCFHEVASEKYEKELLNHYYQQLEIAVDNTVDYQGVKEEWSELYRYAWADFYRFLDGWSPGHWKMHNYSKRLTQQVINELTLP